VQPQDVRISAEIDNMLWREDERDEGQRAKPEQCWIDTEAEQPYNNPVVGRRWHRALRAAATAGK
jgi:hypothetical protein